MPNKNKNKCSKCGNKHYPPTGKKCMVWQEAEQSTEVEESTSDMGSTTVPSNSMAKQNSYAKQKSSNPAKGSSTVPSATMEARNSFDKHKSPTEEDKLSSEEEDTVSLQILKQLKRVNDRLDAVEEKVADVVSGDSKDQQTRQKQDRKLSKHSSCKKYKRQRHKSSSSSDDDSSSSSSSQDESVVNVPNLKSLRTSMKIQKQVDARIRDLEKAHDNPGIEKQEKIKSKRGGNVEVLVQNKVAWPHEAILGGASRSRLSYDQLTMAQWVMGFCRNVIDEKDDKNKERMLSYMSDLMEDVSDFGWQGAKAAHAVLCCEMERGTVKWSDSNRIDRIRRAHAQRHRNDNTKHWGKNSDTTKRPWFCKPFQTGNCTYDKDHDVNGRQNRHICAHCASQGRILTHPEKDCLFAKKQAKN